MFTAEFFEKTLPEQAKKLAEPSDEGVCTVEVSLLDVSYKIVRVIEAAENWVILEVYPHAKAPKRNTKEARAAGAPQFQFDRVAVRYSAVLKITFTLSRPSSGIGFLG
jgi:hypothetical protein